MCNYISTDRNCNKHVLKMNIIQLYRQSQRPTDWSLGCPSITKFWSSDFCFAPKLNLGLDNFKLFFRKITNIFFSYSGQGSTLVESRRMTWKILFQRDTLLVSCPVSVTVLCQKWDIKVSLIIGPVRKFICDVIVNCNACLRNCGKSHLTKYIDPSQVLVSGNEDCQATHPLKSVCLSSQWKSDFLIDSPILFLIKILQLAVLLLHWTL